MHIKLRPPVICGVIHIDKPKSPAITIRAHTILGSDIRLGTEACRIMGKTFSDKRFALYDTPHFKPLKLSA